MENEGQNGNSNAEVMISKQKVSDPSDPSNTISVQENIEVLG